METLIYNILNIKILLGVEALHMSKRKKREEKKPEEKPAEEKA
jgi:hypothetical protein